MTIISLRRLGILLPILSVILGLAFLLIDPVPLQILRNHLFDQYQRWHQRDYIDAPVRIIVIDEDSLTRIGQWPWPRTRIAELVEKLKAANVAAIGFDIIFAEPDRTSPQAMATLWSLKDPLRDELKNLPDHDNVLANSINGAGVVLGFVVQRGAIDGKPDADNVSAAVATVPARPFRYINAGPPPGHWLHAFDSAITALPELEKVAQGNGALSFMPDGDGVVRRVPLVLQLAGEPIPSLVSETLRVAQGERNYVLKTEGGDIGLAEIRIGQFKIPTTAHGEMWVHFSDDVADRYLSAWKVLAGEIPDELLDGHMVLIGLSAQGFDLRFSPLGRIIPGIEVHAQALEQILSGHTLQRPSWARSAESIAIIIGGLAIGFLAIRTKALFAASTTLVCLTIVLVGGWHAFRHYGLLLDTTTPTLVFALTFTSGSLLHHFISEREHRWIKEVFTRYVSPNRVSYLIDHPDTMKLGGSRQECSFVFTDLAGFTKLMERIDPSEAVTLLNTYFDQMIAIAFRHDGTLDRIVGDAVAIMFSAPVPQSDHRARALACALEMDVFATGFADEFTAKGIGFGKTRIGIHSGEVIVGNFGGSTIFDYRALGDPVNTTSRLESANKFFGTNICLSESTLSGCPDTSVRPICRLVLKGKSQVLRVFEPLTAHRLGKYAPLEEYQTAYQLMADEARAAATNMFRDLSARYPDDPLVAFHLQRLDEGALGDLIIDRRK
jgi:adenylate cyclase